MKETDSLLPEALDAEWVHLMAVAKQLGLTPSQIRIFLRAAKKRDKPVDLSNGSHS